MPLAQQVKLMNPNSGIVVVTPDPDKPKSYLRFEAAGDDMLGDERYVTRETLQQPDLIKAIQRGLLVVEGLSEDDPLVDVLRTRKTKKAEAGPERLQIQNVDFNEHNEYKMTTTYADVPVDALVRV